MTKGRPIFINGVGILSPQKTYFNSEFLTEITEYDKSALTTVHPDFKEYINPVQLRRMSRMLRIGLTAATICLRDSGPIKPDGIVTASGFGFLEETAKFLTEILDQDEKQLTPTYFMQSTYNALSGFIAMNLKCDGYCNTYVGRGHAFETALLDAMMLVTATPSSNILLGGFDEAEKADFKVLGRIGHYKNEAIQNLKLFESDTAGTIQGESAAFFMLGPEPTENSWCKILGQRIIYFPTGLEEIKSNLNSFLSENELDIADIDVVIHGQSGDRTKDASTLELLALLFNQTPQARFKHLSGEYCTSTSFALWLGASMIRHQRIPETTRGNSVPIPTKIKTILLFNHYQSKNFSFHLLRSLEG
jgi:3-oxoacyl-[acyl-carrier-protein] synthase II